MKYSLLYFPGIACKKKLTESAWLLLCLDFFNLRIDALVVGWSLYVADYAECHWKLVFVGSIAVWVVAHHGELEMESEVAVVAVVNEEVIFGDAVLAYCHALDVPAIEHEPLVAVLAIDHWLAVFEEDSLVGTNSRVGDDLVCSVFPYHTVGKHLYNACTLVLGSSYHHLDRVRDVAVERTGKEVATSTKTELCWAEWGFAGAVRLRLGDSATLRGWRILSLGQTIDLVVEDDDVEVDVATHGMDEVVATDGKTVAIARAVPY